MGKKFNEIYKDKLVKIEKENKEDKSIVISGIFCKGDVKNSNGREYSSDILQREIERIQKLLQSGESVFSNTGEHEINVGNVSHKVNEIFWDEDEKVGYVNAQLLDTKSGKTVRAIINGGGSLYFSMLGTGEENSQGKVADSYRMKNVNISIASSFADARFNLDNVVGEGVELDQKKGLSEEEITDKFKQAKMANFEGTLKLYKEKFVQPKEITSQQWAQYKAARIAGFTGRIEDYLKIKK